MFRRNIFVSFDVEYCLCHSQIVVFIKIYLSCLKFLVSSLLCIDAMELKEALTTNSNVTRGTLHFSLHYILFPAKFPVDSLKFVEN